MKTTESQQAKHQAEHLYVRPDYRMKKEHTLSESKRTAAEIDRQWIDTAKLRLAELRSGKVKPIPSRDVLFRLKAISSKQ